MFRTLLISILIFITNASHAYVLSGYAEADITPTDFEGLQSCMGGYGVPFERCGVLESASKIKVSALSIVDKNTSVILVSMDTIGIGYSLKQDIIQKTFELSRGQLSESKILISATHTHSGPDLQGLWGGVDPEYRDRLINTAARVILNAYIHKVRAKIFAWTAEANIENRRGLDVVDTQVEILDFRSLQFGHRIATMVNMSAHPTLVDSTTLAWSSDYVGHLRTTLDSKLNTNTIFFNGILGDAQPATDGFRGLEVAADFGETTASLIAIEAQNAELLSTNKVSYSQAKLRHTIENPLILGALKFGLLDANTNDSDILTQVGILSIGRSFSAVVFPGEALTNLGLPMQNSLKTQNSMFLGLTGDALGYFIPSEEFGSIPGRTTEENASISSSIGESVETTFIYLLKNKCKKYSRNCRKH